MLLFRRNTGHWTLILNVSGEKKAADGQVLWQEKGED